MNIIEKELILESWKSKISYPLNYKDIEELKGILNYYEQQLKNKQEVINKIKEYSENLWLDDKGIVFRLRERIKTIEEKIND